MKNENSIILNKKGNFQFICIGKFHNSKQKRKFSIYLHRKIILKMFWLYSTVGILSFWQRKRKQKEFFVGIWRVQRKEGTSLNDIVIICTIWAWPYPTQNFKICDVPFVNNTFSEPKLETSAWTNWTGSEIKEWICSNYVRSIPKSYFENDNMHLQQPV